MAEGDAHPHNQLLYNLLNGVYNLANGGHTLKLSLCTGMMPALTSTLGISGCTKFTGANYVDKTLASQATSQDDSGNKGVFDAADVTWTALGAASPAVSYVALWDDTVTSPTADAVLGMWDLTTQPNGGDYTLVFNASGIINISRG